MKRLLSALLLFVFFTASYADVGKSPPVEKQQIETSFENIVFEVDFTVMEIPGINPIRFVEVEISPGDMIVQTYMYKNTRLNFLINTATLRYRMKIDSYNMENLKASAETDSQVNRTMVQQERRCLLLYSDLGSKTCFRNNYLTTYMPINYN